MKSYSPFKNGLLSIFLNRLLFICYFTELYNRQQKGENVILFYSTLCSLLFYSTFPHLEHHLPKKTGVSCAELCCVGNHHTQKNCCLTNTVSKILVENLAFFQMIITWCVWLLTKVPTSILSHDLLENMCILQIQNERQDTKNAD